MKLIRVLLSGLDGNGLGLKSLLDVSPPSVCGILRSGPSGTRMDSQWSGFFLVERRVFHTRGGGPKRSIWLMISIILLLPCMQRLSIRIGHFLEEKKKGIKKLSKI